jgi:hypothetical protein
MKPFTLFQFSAVGYPGAVAGCIYMALWVPMVFRPKRAPGAKAETFWERFRYGPFYSTRPDGYRKPTQSTTLDVEASAQSSMLPVEADFGSRGSPRYVVSHLSVSSGPYLAHIFPLTSVSHLARISGTSSRYSSRASVLSSSAPLPPN